VKKYIEVKAYQPGKKKLYGNITVMHLKECLGGDEMTKNCKICKKEFETNNRRKVCCCSKCADINKRIITKQWNELHGTDYQRKKRNGCSLCRICGEPMHRDVHKRSTATMHDECVYSDCMKVLKEGKKLSNTQIQRLYTRGYTLKEFIEEYVNNE
jgi:hypothetical protein